MLWRTLYNRVHKLYDKQIDAHGLAIFRIAYSLVLLGEIIHIFYYRHLIFDKIPYLVPGEIDLTPALVIWMLSVLCLMFGLATRYAAIINYILTVAIIGTASTFEYHMFYAYLSLNALLIFIPVSRCLSIDRLGEKLRYSNTRFRYNPPTTVSVLAYYIPVFIGIGFVYFDSIFHKLASDFWVRGLGLWLPAVLPQTVFIDTTVLMNIKWLVIFLGYLTLVFEAIFIFVFWRKQWRLVCFIIGVGLHLGILVCFPIPFFALGVIALYLLLVPVSFWKRLFSVQPRSGTSRLTFYYDSECPLCARTRIIVEYLDTQRKIKFVSVQHAYTSETNIHHVSYDDLLDNVYSVDKKGRIYKGFDTYIQVLRSIWYLKILSWIARLPIIYGVCKRIYRRIADNRVTERCTEQNCGYEIPPVPRDDRTVRLLRNFSLADFRVTGIIAGLLFACAFQIISIYKSPFLQNLKTRIGIANYTVTKQTERVASSLLRFSKTWFGITQHGVFMDWHFYSYNHSIGVVYINSGGKEQWLPLTKVDGTPGKYLIGHNWVKYTFRVNSPTVDQEQLVEGIRDFTAFWAHKSGVDLSHARFLIKVKKNEQPTRWEKDFLHRQLANPWIDAGYVEWQDGSFEAHVVDIESL